MEKLGGGGVMLYFFLFVPADVKGRLVGPSLLAVLDIIPEKSHQCCK